MSYSILIGSGGIVAAFMRAGKAIRKNPAITYEPANIGLGKRR